MSTINKSTTKSARAVALMALERVRREDSYSDEVLRALLDKYGLDTREAALVSRLVYSVLQNRLLCDFYISRYSRTAPEKLEPKVLDILRMTVCQLLFFDRIPQRAAVNEAVNLAVFAGLERASGLINAVSRRIAENLDKLPEIPGEGTAGYLSVRYSHPLWLVESYVNLLGYEQAAALMEAHNGIAGTAIQLNPLKTTIEELADSLSADGAEVTSHTWQKGCLEIGGAGDVRNLSAYAKGWFYVQDAGARAAAEAAGISAGQRIFDACAAPGGKSFAAAALAGGDCEIVAADINERRLRLVDTGGERLGFSCIRTVAGDAKAPEWAYCGYFDVVLADLPCSGLGAIRKKPEIRYKDPASFEGLPEMQLEMLTALADCVAGGGVLLYSTCTTREEENAEVVAEFMKLRNDFAPEPFALAEGNISAPQGSLTLWSHLHETDGFFICKLRRLT